MRYKEKEVKNDGTSQIHGRNSQQNPCKSCGIMVRIAHVRIMLMRNFGSFQNSRILIPGNSLTYYPEINQIIVDL